MVSEDADALEIAREAAERFLFQHPGVIQDGIALGSIVAAYAPLNKSDGRLRGRAKPTSSRHIAQPLLWNDRIMVIDSEGILSSLYLKTP